MLEKRLKKRMEQQPILLMTHLVMGYPSFDDCFRIVEGMVEAGVDLMELQIPFSEPIADGPVILKANQRALEAGATVDRCFEFAHQATQRFDVPFLFMTYYNILFKRGVRTFVQEMKRVGVQGAIVPDLPPEEASEYLEAMKEEQLAPVFIVTPRTSEARMRELSKQGEGLMYCVARKGVTGSQTELTAELEGYLLRCRTNCKMPLAVGFGVQTRQDVDYLRGKADVAVIGSQTLRLVADEGVGAVPAFIRSLRDN